MKMSSLYAKDLLEKMLTEKERDILLTLLDDSKDPEQKIKLLIGEDADV